MVEAKEQFDSYEETWERVPASDSSDSNQGAAKELDMDELDMSGNLGPTLSQDD